MGKKRKAFDQQKSYFISVQRFCAEKPKDVLWNLHDNERCWLVVCLGQKPNGATADVVDNMQAQFYVRAGGQLPLKPVPCPPAKCFGYSSSM